MILIAKCYYIFYKLFLKPFLHKCKICTKLVRLKKYFSLLINPQAKRNFLLRLSQQFGNPPKLSTNLSFGQMTGRHVAQIFRGFKSSKR